MATVKLYFEPYPENDADGLVIEESADGVSGWSNIEDLGSGAIGSFPNYISSYTTSNATDLDQYFRIAWKVGGVPQNYSDAVQVGELAPKYTTPDLIRETTRLTSLSALDTIYIQELINQAYYLVQNECGPFDEEDTAFIEIAPMAMRLYVEYLSVVQDPANLSALTGTIEEKIGSYRYKKSDKAVELYQEAGEGVPTNITALMCPYSTRSDDTPTEAISTEVFPPTRWYDGEEEDLERKWVYTQEDSMQNAPSVPPDTTKKFPSN